MYTGYEAPINLINTRAGNARHQAQVSNTCMSWEYKLPAMCGVITHSADL